MDDAIFEEIIPSVYGIKLTFPIRPNETLITISSSWISRYNQMIDLKPYYSYDNKQSIGCIVYLNAQYQSTMPLDNSTRLYLHQIAQ